MAVPLTKYVCLVSCNACPSCLLCCPERLVLSCTSTASSQRANAALSIHLRLLVTEQHYTHLPTWISFSLPYCDVSLFLRQCPLMGLGQHSPLILSYKLVRMVTGLLDASEPACNSNSCLSWGYSDSYVASSLVPRATPAAPRANAAAACEEDVCLSVGACRATAVCQPLLLLHTDVDSHIFIYQVE